MLATVQEDLRTHGGDWSRPGFLCLVVHRFGTWRYGVRPRVLRRVLSFVYKIAYPVVQMLTGIELPCEARVGRRLRIDHFGGIIVSGFASIGDDCVLRNGTTIGLRYPDRPEAPRIGDRVDIGAGAILLGGIGDDARIGAGAVVFIDVPAGATAVGNPARIIYPAHGRATSTKVAGANRKEVVHHAG